MIKEGCCGECRHYQFRDTYCYLMDDITQPEDNCGMFERGVELE